VLATWTGTQLDDPFSELAPTEGVMALQVFLSVLAIPLLCLAAVVKERRLANERLAEQLRFEELLSRFSSAFVHLPLQEVDGAVQGWLGRLGEFLDLDRSALLLSSDDGGDLVVSHTWRRPGLEPRPMFFARRDYPWAVHELGHMRPFLAARLDALPPEAARDVETLRRDHVRSILTLPLVSNGRVFGALALLTTARERDWPAELIQQLRLMAEVFAGVLSRRQIVGALQSSEAMKSAILGSLSSNVAVLDREGRIIAVNQGWTKFALDHNATFDESLSVGINYLDVCRQAAGRGAAPAAAVLGGIQTILDGTRPRFSLEYICDPPCGAHWFALSVVPLRRSEGGAVVAHTEITARKRAEAEAQRRREELAHFTRVSTLGELVASLTHELKQPLTAILNNAQAGRRLLDLEPADSREIRAVFTDIVEDDRRAAEVIQRLRDLLRRGEVEQAPLDVNVLVRDVVKLVTSDALLRNVSLGLDLTPEPLTVKGDGIELRQVVLNLLLNAMDAVAECAREERTVIVQTRGGGDGTARVSVQDTGTGLRDDTRDLIFEPFYTTKPGGMGMGLSIARSILEAHGGTIGAGNNRTRGATFNVSLPLVNEHVK
jgi:signal transduction histidine kinase